MPQAKDSDHKPWLDDPHLYMAMHRRLAWGLRLSVMINVGLIALAIVLGSAISVMMPLKEIRIALLRVDSEDKRVYRVEPISKEVNGYDLLFEQFAERYVRLLLEIDGISQTDRFQEAWIYTSDEYYNKFDEERLSTGEIDKAIASGLNRSIVIESTDLISERDDVRRYAVDFQQIDSRKGKEIERKKLRAYLAIETKPHKAEEGEQFDNPHGFRVLDMSIKEKEIK